MSRPTCAQIGCKTVLDGRAILSGRVFTVSVALPWCVRVVCSSE